MAILSQGSKIYFIDPADDSVVAVECATAFNPGGNPADQIETTCLEEFDRSYLPGLRTPGQAALTVNFDPANASHVRIYELSQENPPPVLSWVLGFSDGTAAPTVDSSGDFVLPTTRSWFPFQGYIADVPFDLAANSVVTSAMSIQRSGSSALIPKV
jgi:hypothetical protein